jgi:hypothetical protein
LAGGFFTNIGGMTGMTRNHLARLDATTGAPDEFNPNADDPVYAIAVQMDGRIVVGGAFLTMGGQTRRRIARLNTDGTLDAGFNPDAGGDVYSVVVQGDGKVLAGGAFPFIGGVPARHLLGRLDAVTGKADSFNPNPNNTVNSIALQQDGKILAGGVFTTVGSAPRNRFARISNDTAALSSLMVTQTTITLTRAGSAPQFTHVTFGSDYEGDGIFGLVGSGMPTGSGYTLTGLNFPTGQTFQIRSRGYFRTGYLNGSETTEYNFKNVLLRKLRIIAITRSGADMMVTYDANAANTYQLDRKLELNDASWLPIPEVEAQTPKLDGAATFVVPGAITSGGRAFYRVRLLP